MDKIRETYKRCELPFIPSQIYGMEHLIRLMVRLPTYMNPAVGSPQEYGKAILRINELLKYITKHQSLFCGIQQLQSQEVGTPTPTVLSYQHSEIIFSAYQTWTYEYLTEHHQSQSIVPATGLNIQESHGVIDDNNNNNKCTGVISKKRPIANISVEPVEMSRKSSSGRIIKAKVNDM